MPYITNPLDLYKHLPRTNCGQCGIATCLAFAAAVLREEKPLPACPFLDSEALAGLEPLVSRQVNLDSIREEQLNEFRRKIKKTDIVGRAAAIGARVRGASIIIDCLGKEFEVTPEGAIASSCHTHAWFSLPLLDYVLHCSGVEPAGRWVPFRELPAGGTWAPLFQQRCEKPLRRIADAYSDLFADLVSLFSASSSAPAFDSHVSVVLHPLPRVPMLICYWQAEDGMESKLHLFFEKTAERNLPIDSLFTLGTGIARMLEKIMHTHTDGKSELS